MAIKLTFSESGMQAKETLTYFCGSNQIADLIFNKQQPGTSERGRYFQATEQTDVNGWHIRYSIVIFIIQVKAKRLKCNDLTNDGFYINH